MSATAALERAWHRESAAASLERWRQVCLQEGWGRIPAREDRLVSVFGASWYFTRFVFFRGAEAARLFDEPLPGEPWSSYAAVRLEAAAGETGDDGAGEGPLDRVRIARNEIMLRALIGWLDGSLDQEQLEAALTAVAEAVLAVLMRRFVYGDGGGPHMSALGLGRLAGAEMNFGSDLDLIFLYQDGTGDMAHVARGVRALLRHMATASPYGSFYEVDMRLRPHGTGGALITTAASFVEYHAGERAVWERQMMTRCRPVCDPYAVGARTMARILPLVYRAWDPAALRQEISAMRLRVERELGRPQGKFELKRGPGGIMDIDFLSHYLQLAHGNSAAALHTCSTRAVLRRARDLSLLDGDAAGELLNAYDYLKRIETCVRLFDVRNISAIPRDPAVLAPLARATGRGDDVAAFQEDFLRTTALVRNRFQALMG